MRGVDLSGDHYENEIGITTAEDIMHFLSSIHRHADASPSSAGFYGAVGDLFYKLAEEEGVAGEHEGAEPIHYPSFGTNDDKYEAVVRPFYSVWSGFITRKSFSWKEIHRYSEARDRKSRRKMEKDNKQLRDESVREFNDAVRSLVAFVRKRDPRYKPSKQTEADRQKVLRDAAVAQAARSRAANHAKFMEEAIPDWIPAGGSAPSDGSDEDRAASNQAKQVVECVVCRKTFKSEKQYEAHEKSKKHAKTVQQLRFQLQREDEFFNTKGSDATRDSSVEAVIDIDNHDQEGQLNIQNGPENSVITGEDTCHLEATIWPRLSGRKLSPSNSDGGLGEDSKLRLSECIKPLRNTNASSYNAGGLETDSPVQKPPDMTVPIVGQCTEKTVMGKAKEKRAKKAMEKTTNAEIHFKCMSCKEQFPSKNRLFKHLKLVGHAQFVGGGDF